MPSFSLRSCYQCLTVSILHWLSFSILRSTRLPRGRTCGKKAWQWELNSSLRMSRYCNKIVRQEWEGVAMGTIREDTMVTRTHGEIEEVRQWEWEGMALWQQKRMAWMRKCGSENEVRQWEWAGMATRTYGKYEKTWQWEWSSTMRMKWHGIKNIC